MLRKKKLTKKTSNNKKQFSILLLVFSIFFMVNDCICQDSLLFNVMYAKSVQFSENYTAQYFSNGQKLVVPSYQMPEKKLNDYLFQSITRRDFRLLKFAVVMFDKQYEEYGRLGVEDYMLDDDALSQNGFIEMARVFLNLPNDSNSYMAPIYTSQIIKKLISRISVIFNL